MKCCSAPVQVAAQAVQVVGEQQLHTRCQATHASEEAAHSTMQATMQAREAACYPYSTGPALPLLTHGAH